MTSKENWIHLYSFPNSNIKTFSQLVSFEQQGTNLKSKITIANLNIEKGTSDLLTYNENNLMGQLKIPELVSGVHHFQIGPDELAYPALAVSAGSKIYIYKNLRPFFRYSLPELAPNEQESQIWETLKIKNCDIQLATAKLKKLMDSDVKLTLRSQMFLGCSLAEKQQFIENQPRNVPLSYQSQICCLSSVKKKNTYKDEVDHLIVGTEDSKIYIIETTSFKVIKEIKINGVPVFVSSHGSLNMQCEIFVSNRLSRINVIETNEFKVKNFLHFSVPIIGIFSTPEGLIVASQDRLIQMFDKNSEKIWTQKMPAEFLSFRGIYDYLDWKLVASLSNKQVFLYVKRNLCSVINMDFQIQTIAFGQYSAFKNVLVGVTQGGGLEMFSTYDKTMRNSVIYDPSQGNEVKTSMKLSKISKFGLPEISRREGNNYKNIHKILNFDYTFMRLKITKELATATLKNLLPVTEFEDMKVKVEWQFDGFGPTFMLKLEVKNVGAEKELTNLFIIFDYDNSNYEFENDVITIPMVIPGMSYKTSTKIFCLEDAGFFGMVELRLIHKDTLNPLTLLDLEVPANEPFEA